MNRVHAPVLLLAAVAFSADARDAAAQSPIVRASVDSAGVEGNSDSGTFSPGSANGPSIAISGDGRFVAFQSSASNLVADDANGRDDVFVHDRATGAMTRMSVDRDGGDSNHASRSPALSGDGRWIAFCSDATDLVLDDGNIYQDIYLRDRDPDGNGLFDEGNGVTTRISVAAGGGDPNGPSSFPVISSDGQVIAFVSQATNLVADDANGWDDLFVHHRSTGVTSRANVAPDGSEANHAAGNPCISGDGNLIGFHSFASNLVAGDANGTTDVFLRDVASGVTLLVSRHLRGVAMSAVDPAISADGRFVAFWSLADDFVDGDTNGFFDVFRHELATGETIRVSVGPAGEQGDSGSVDPSLSADGSLVGFSSSARNFAPLDFSNQSSDVFWRDCVAGETLCASSDLVGVPSDWRSEVVALSGDGRALAFVSTSRNLVPDDTNFDSDVFVFDRDAMIDAAWNSYGTGTAGTLGVPAFTAQTPPEFGTTLTLDLGNSLGQWTVAFVAGGLGETDLPFAGGRLLVDPISVLLLVPIAPPGSTLEVEIPFDVGLHDVTLWAQLIEFDAGAPKGLSFSPGLRLELGR